MRVSVTVDDREPAALIAAVRDHPDVASVAVERLLAGDVVVRAGDAAAEESATTAAEEGAATAAEGGAATAVGDENQSVARERAAATAAVGIERKTLRDYVGSVMGRSGPDLHDQVERLRERYDAAYVLLEGDFSTLEDLQTGVSSAAIRGSMASITARYGVPVVPCTDLPSLVDYAVRLGRKHLEAPSARLPAAGAVPSRREPTPLRMYGCIDGIGPQLAATLYERYPTVAELAAASLEDLRRIEGIGETRAKRIRAALHDVDS